MIFIVVIYVLPLNLADHFEYTKRKMLFKDMALKIFKFTFIYFIKKDIQILYTFVALFNIGLKCFDISPIEKWWGKGPPTL